jgi:glutamate synthase domain-containing protein 1
MYIDTEVLAYAFDLLVRRHKMPIELAAKVLATPYWEEIDAMETRQRLIFTGLRQVYRSLMANGPFSVVVARHGELIGLTDRKKLRPLIAGVKDDFLYISSEEAAIRLISPKLNRIMRPSSGEIIVGRLNRLSVIEVPI